MVIERRMVDIHSLMRAVEAHVGEPEGSIRGIVIAILSQDDTLSLLHNAPDLTIASDIVAQALIAVAQQEGMPYTVYVA